MLNMPRKNLPNPQFAGRGVFPVVDKYCFFINLGKLFFFLNIIIPSFFNTFHPFNLFSLSPCWAQTDSLQELNETLPCDVALKKLDNALENCIGDDMKKINDLYDETGAGCLKEVLPKKNKEFFQKCFDLEQSVSECRLDKILVAEGFLKKYREQLASYRLVRESLLSAKCVGYFNNCVKSKVEDAYNRQDIKSMSELEKRFYQSFKAFKNCADFKEIILFIRKKKSEYFRKYLSKSLDDSLEKGDLELLMETRDIVTRYFMNCHDYSRMTNKIKRIMCFFFERWHLKTHEKIIQNCDFKLLDLVKKFGTSEELGYCNEVDFEMESVNMKENKKKVSNTKCIILLKCGQKGVKTIADKCDPEQLNQLFKIINSCEGTQKDKRAVKQEVCLPLTDCFIDDISTAAHNCDFRRLKLISNFMNLLDNYECQTKEKVIKSFSNAKKEYVLNCLKRNLEIGKSLCDFDRIASVQRFVKMPFWGKKFRKFSVKIIKTKRFMGKFCLEAELDRSVSSCEYPVLNKLITYAKEGMLNYPPKEELTKLLDEAKLKFSETCLEEEVENSFEYCQVEAFLKWEDIINEEFAHVSQAPEILEKIEKQKNLVFDHCFKSEILEAKLDFNIYQIQDLEENVEKYLRSLPNISDYREFIREAKNYCLRGGM
jgi:hypothetical protein